MAEAEDQYRQELADNGVELPAEDKAEDAPEDKSENAKPAEPDPAAAKPEPKKDGEADAPADDKGKDEKGEDALQDVKSDEEQPPRKRSIYDDYKDKKDEAKALRVVAVEALKARGVAVTGNETIEELQAKLTETPAHADAQERTEPLTDLEAFAEKFDADPEVLREWRELMLKGIKPTIDPELKTRLEAFESWQAKNALVVEKALFDEEYTVALPAIKELFPTANDEELGKIKTKLDEFSHTKDFHDKELGYVAFRHRKELEALVSPRKKGMEGKGRRDGDVPAYEFDPNADTTKMSPAELERWSEEYGKLGTEDKSSLATDANGKKIFI